MIVLKVDMAKGNNYIHRPSEKEIIEIYLRYITRTRVTDKYPAAYVGYLGFGPYASIENLIEGFKEVQATHRSYTGVLARHEIVSFDQGDTLDVLGRQKIVSIAYRFALWYFNQGFQVVFAIHLDTDHLHIHYVLNTVNIFTGNKYHSNKNILKIERKYLEDVVKYLTGRREASVELSDYIDCYDDLVAVDLLERQRPIPGIHFEEMYGQKIIY